MGEKLEKLLGRLMEHLRNEREIMNDFAELSDEEMTPEATEGALKAIYLHPHTREGLADFPEIRAALIGTLKGLGLENIDELVARWDKEAENGTET